MLSAQEENEKYNLSCPFNPEVMCIQMPNEPEDDNYCDDGCPNRKSTPEVPNERDDCFGPFI